MTALANRYDGILFLIVVTASIAVTLAGLAPGVSYSVLLLILGVILLGLPHGALDVLVAKRVFRLSTVPAFLLFLLSYIGVAALYGIVWWWSPAVGLASFLCFSAIHFSTDLDRRGNLITRLAYGATVLSMPAMGHASEVRQIFRALAVAAPENIVLVLQIIALPLGLIALVAAYNQRRERSRDLLELAGIVVGGILLPPLLYFICYFCFLHSPRHMFATAREEGLIVFRQIATNAVLPTIAAAGLIWAVSAGWGRHSLTDRLLQSIFVGLAVLTIPHMLLKVLAQPHFGSPFLARNQHRQLARAARNSNL